MEVQGHLRGAGQLWGAEHPGAESASSAESNTSAGIVVTHEALWLISHVMRNCLFYFLIFFGRESCLDVWFPP